MERRRPLKRAPGQRGVDRPPHAHRPPRPPFDLDDAIYGIHAVEEALAAGERLRALHVAADRTKDAALRALLARAKACDLTVRFEPRAFFAALPFKAHQGVVAVTRPFPYAALDALLRTRPAQPRLFVLLDHLTDPHNVGAIVRTAECVGADALLLPDRRSAGINATVRKSAAGAAAHLPIVRVGNLGEAMRTLKAAGVWIVGADAGPEAQPLPAVDLRVDLGLVIGAEGAGLAPSIRRGCDALVGIPMRGRVASLNASVAAGVLLYEALRQRGYPAAKESDSRP